LWRSGRANRAILEVEELLRRAPNKQAVIDYQI